MGSSDIRADDSGRTTIEAALMQFRSGHFAVWTPRSTERVYGHSMRNLRLSLVVTLALVSCGIKFPSNCVAGSISGMIVIKSASFSDTGAAVGPVTLTNAVRDGVSISAAELATNGVGGQVSGVRVEGESVICDVTCTFAIPGSYSFDAAAQGAVTQRALANTPPRDAGGGCGGVTTGTPVTLNLKFARQP
jgi:hypothetical protein